MGENPVSLIDPLGLAGLKIGRKNRSKNLNEIANQDQDPFIKQLPSDAIFLIDYETVACVEKSVRLTSPVRSYLSGHAGR